MTSTGPDPFGPATGTSEGRDPADALAAAMRDLWGFGAAMMQAAATSAAPARDHQQDAYQLMAAPAAGLLEAYAEMMARLAGAGGVGEGAAQQAAGLSPALVEAGSVAMGSTIRYGQALAEVCARHQGNLVAAASARFSETPPPERHRAEVEELRAFLRDVGDTAVLEARRLEQELAQIGEAAAQAAAPSSPDGPHKRRWAAKP